MRQVRPIKIIFIQNLPWFLIDRQARVLPEFILMYAGNEIQINNTLLEKNRWQLKQVLKIEIYGISVYGVIKINKKLSNKVVLANFFELESSISNISLDVERY